VWLIGNEDVRRSLSPGSLEINSKNILGLTKNLQYNGYNFISEILAALPTCWLKHIYINILSAQCSLFSLSFSTKKKVMASYHCRDELHEASGSLIPTKLQKVLNFWSTSISHTTATPKSGENEISGFSRNYAKGCKWNNNNRLIVWWLAVLARHKTQREGLKSLRGWVRTYY